MFTQSFHNHTYRCNHADGTEREYVEEAVRGGMEMLGFSDHAPYVFEGDYYSGFRMRPEEAAGYFDTVSALREEYKGKLDIRMGFEAEYYPRFFAAFEKLISSMPAEYLLLGQHFTRSEVDGHGSTRPVTDGEELTEFVSQVIEAMKTGMFCCVAHPDIFNFRGDALVYEREIRRLCESSVLCGVPLEINLLGIRTNRHYPNPEFWRIAGEVGVDAVVGGDAHTPGDVHDTVSYAKAVKMAEKYGVKLHEASFILKGGHTLR